MRRYNNTPAGIMYYCSYFVTENRGIVSTHEAHLIEIVEIFYNKMTGSTDEIYLYTTDHSIN